jgi:hypothetical protein
LADVPVFKQRGGVRKESAGRTLHGADVGWDADDSRRHLSD